MPSSPRLVSQTRSLTLPSMPEIRLPVHWKRHSVCEPWTNQNYSPTNPGCPLESLSRCFASLLPLFVSFFNIPRIWDDRKSISGKRKTSQCILKSSLVPQCSHPCISCEDAAPASTKHLPISFSPPCAALSLVSCPLSGLPLAVTRRRLLTSGLCNLFSHRIPLIPAAPHPPAAWGTRTVSKLNFSSFFWNNWLKSLWDAAMFMGSKLTLPSFSYILYFATIIHFSRPSVKTQDDSTFRQTNNLLKTILMILFMVTVFVIQWGR